MKPGAVVAGMLDPFDAEGLMRLAAAGLTGFALEAAPRITRAQSLDVLSSQANLAGYKAVLLAAHYYGRLFPMMMTAAGTPQGRARRGAGRGRGGPAGHRHRQAPGRGGRLRRASRRARAGRIAGREIHRRAVRNRREREIAQGVGGYARPMPPSWMARQAALVSERCKQADIIITTALIPGRPAPTLVSAETVAGMKPGSVLVDLAVERGGNCPLTERGQVVEKHGVTLVGLNNLPGMVATDASALYARNLQDFLKLISNADGALQIQRDDEIVAACLVCEGGNVTRRT